MNPLTLIPAVVLAAALQGAAWAGPVASEASEPAATTTTTTAAAAAGTVPQGTSARGPGAAGRSAEAVETVEAGAASAPTGSALVLEMLKEADASATLQGDAQPARPRNRDSAAPAAGAAATSAKSKQDDGQSGLRDIGKAAMRWAKHMVPWLRSEDDEADAARAEALRQPGWSGSALDRDAQRTRRLAEAGAHAPSQTEVIHGDAQRQQRLGGDHEQLRDIIDGLRLVLEHPMTWLVIALFVIGGFVVKRIDRRPTE